MNTITMTRKSAALALAIALMIPPIAYAEEPLDPATESTTASSSVETSTETNSTDTASATSTAGSSVSTSTESMQLSADESTAATSSSDLLTIHASSSAPTPGTEIESVSDTATSSGSSFLEASSTVPLADARSSFDVASTTPEVASTTPATSTPSLAVASTSQTITTGESTAFANILNILNATFLNSTGAILFANFTDETGDVDLRAGTLFDACDASGCAGLHGVSLNQLQDAYIDNDILVSAHTGDNTIQHASSSAGISTGDAFAGLNLVNLANVSFIDANYLVVTMNAFRGVNGDIVLPGLSQFFGGLVTALGGGSSVSNNGTVSNEVSVAAQSGNNSVNDAPASIVTAGESDAQVNIFNQLNSTATGNGLWLLLRVSGTWNGDIVGLPEGLTAVKTPHGAAIVGNGRGTLGGVLILQSTTTTGIANNVAVEATTGDNSIEHASSTAVISTGDAYAGANIINIANQTVMGRNWLLAVMNIFGDFNGSITFGRPDLWMGDKVESDGPVQNGTVLTYTLTLANTGDADAHGVVVHESPDRAHLTVLDASVPYTVDAAGDLNFAIGTLAHGDTKEITYRARIQDVGSDQAITNDTHATLTETDNNTADNHDSVTIRAIVIPVSPGGSGGTTITIGTPDARGGNTDATKQRAVDLERTSLTVERSSSAVDTTSGSPLIRQHLLIKNTGAAIARGVVLFDVLRDPSGETVHEERWDIGSLAPQEAVEISYELGFGADAPDGIYTIEARLSGENVAGGTFAHGTIELIADERMPEALPIVTLASPPLASSVVTNMPAKTDDEPEALPLIPNAGGSSSTVPLVDPEALTAAAGTVDIKAGQTFVLFFAGLFVLGALYQSLTRRRV